MRVAGVLGAVLATLGNILPSCIIMLILARLYEKYSKQTLLKQILGGVRPVVVAAIFSAGLVLLQLALTSFSQPDLFALVVFAVAFVLLNSKRIPLGPIALLVLGAGVGILHSVLA
jgi:chromate transporter